jgi:hypothetical protein
MKKVKLFIVGRLEKMTKGFVSGNLSRMPIEMNINGETIICQNHSYYVIKENQEMSIIFFLRLIYKLSINKKMRHELYYENNSMKNLQIILLKGKYFEIYFVLEIVSQLTFDENISSDLYKSAEFKGIIEKLNEKIVNEVPSDDEKKAYQGIKPFIKQIYWNLNKKVFEV